MTISKVSGIIWQIILQKTKYNLQQGLYTSLVELQKQMDGLISDIDDRDNENSKLSEYDITVKLEVHKQAACNQCIMYITVFLASVFLSAEDHVSAESS